MLHPPRQVPLTLLPPHACAYLPGRIARSRGFLCQRMSGELYQQLMDAGFRRSGTLVYQPACVECEMCRPIRVLTRRFEMSKSQRRVWRRNLDLVVSVAKARATDEKFELYARYVRDRHGREEDATREAFESFLYESPLDDTIEMEYRDASGVLKAVGICDRTPAALSSVYCYFDPSERRRGLGTFAALWEIDFARREGLGFYYLGYWVEGSRTMQYKADFEPHEMLGTEGSWR